MKKLLMKKIKESTLFTGEAGLKAMVSIENNLNKLEVNESMLKGIDNAASTGLLSRAQYDFLVKEVKEM